MTHSLTDAVFTSQHLCRLADITRRQLQLLYQAEVLLPARPGIGRQGSAHRWSAMQVLGAAYYAAFLRAGCQSCWGYEAAA
jgi:hypothetical protein